MSSIREAEKEALTLASKCTTEAEWSGTLKIILQELNGPREHIISLRGVNSDNGVIYQELPVHSKPSLRKATQKRGTKKRDNEKPNGADADVDQVEVSSTTKAAEIARDKAGEGAAALGGPLAAELYDLKLLEECIQDRSTNTTRFLVIGEKTCPSTGNDRTSILFAINDRPGSLVSALQAFDHCQINLSKIESRPSKRKDWEYIFYVDLAGHCEDDKVAQALEELNQHCSLVKLLGSYPDTGE